jgi:hypothetical protein
MLRLNKELRWKLKANIWFGKFEAFREHKLMELLRLQQIEGDLRIL